MRSAPTLRVARPTNQLQKISEMYCRALGFSVLASFADHEGFDGVIIGLPGQSYHLEFTARHGRAEMNAPDDDSLLVFYVPDPGEWDAWCSRLTLAGFRSVASVNPFWDREGRTFEDVDGYRVVIQNADWPV